MKLLKLTNWITDDFFSNNKKEIYKNIIVSLFFSSIQNFKIKIILRTCIEQIILIITDLLQTSQILDFHSILEP